MPNRATGYGQPPILRTALSTCHCTSFRHVIPLTATQGLAAEVPAGSRPGLVDGTAPLHNSAAIRLFFPQVPARGVGKEKTVFLPQPPLAEVMQLVGFALPDEDEGEPAAAFATAAAGAGCRGYVMRVHVSTLWITKWVRIADRLRVHQTLPDGGVPEA
jgi:hypothetical protein